MTDFGVDLETVSDDELELFVRTWRGLTPVPAGWKFVSPRPLLGYTTGSPTSATHLTALVIEDGDGVRAVRWACKRVALYCVRFWDEDTKISEIEPLCRRCGSIAELYRHMGALPYGEYVYYARRGNYIKIGFTECIGIRMTALDAELLAIEPGGREWEREQHLRFGAAAVGGEWFEQSPHLMAYIEGLRERFDAQSDLAPWDRVWR